MQALAQAPMGALRLCLDQARAGWADEEAGDVAPGHNIRVKAVIGRALDAETIGQLTACIQPTLGNTRGSLGADRRFLLSANASFITGSYHLVDGGYTAK